MALDGESHRGCDYNFSANRLKLAPFQISNSAFNLDYKFIVQETFNAIVLNSSQYFRLKSTSLTHLSKTQMLVERRTDLL